MRKAANKRSAASAWRLREVLKHFTRLAFVGAACASLIVPRRQHRPGPFRLQCGFRGFSLVHSGSAFHGSLFVIPAQVGIRCRCAEQHKDTGPRPAPGRRQVRVRHQFPKRVGSQQESTRNTKATRHSNTIRGTHNCSSKGPSLYCLWGTISETQAAQTKASRVKCFSTSRKRGTRLPPIAGSRPSASSDAAPRRRQPTMAQRP